MDLLLLIHMNRAFFYCDCLFYFLEGTWRNGLNVSFLAACIFSLSNPTSTNNAPHLIHPMGAMWGAFLFNKIFVTSGGFLKGHKYYVFTSYYPMLYKFPMQRPFPGLKNLVHSKFLH